MNWELKIVHPQASGPCQSLTGIFPPLPVYHLSSTTAQFWVSQRFEQTLNPKYQSWALSSWVLILLFLSFLKTAVKIIKLRLKRSVDAGPVSSCPYYFVAFKERFDLKY